MSTDAEGFLSVDGNADPAQGAEGVFAFAKVGEDVALLFSFHPPR